MEDEKTKISELETLLQREKTIHADFDKYTQLAYTYQKKLFEIRVKLEQHLENWKTNKI